MAGPAVPLTIEPMTWFERLLTKCFKLVQIAGGCDFDPIEGRPIYLRRWFLWGDVEKSRLGCAVMLHKFMRGDEDPEYHDHPWPFLSVVLWRGYIEETPVYSMGFVARENADHTQTIERVGSIVALGVRDRKWPGMLLFWPAGWKHRVELPGGKPVWTLVIRLKKQRSWGFWQGPKFIPWRQFLAEKCERLARHDSSTM